MMAQIALQIVRFLKMPTATPVVLLASLGLCALLTSTVDAYQTIFNPFTGNLDYVGVTSSNVPTGNVVAVYISSGSDQTNNTSSSYITCLDYTSTAAVSTGNFLFFSFIVQGDTVGGAGSELEMQMFQDNTSITSGASGLFLLFAGTRIVAIEGGTLWFKPTDTNTHVYSLRIANVGTGASVNCGNGNNYMITAEIHK